VSPSHQDLSNDTTFSQIKSRVPVPLRDNGEIGALGTQYLNFDVYEN